MDKPKKCPHFEYDVNEIVKNLWLGNVKSAYSKKFLEKYKIKHILTIMDDFDHSKKVPGINYMLIPIKDYQACSYCPVDFYSKTGAFINAALNKSEGILVHCKKGHHRSACTVVSYLIEYYGVEYEQAIKYINSLRRCSLTRDTCMTKGTYAYYQSLKKQKCATVKCQNESGYCYCKCT